MADAKQDQGASEKSSTDQYGFGKANQDKVRVVSGEKKVGKNLIVINPTPNDLEHKVFPGAAKYTPGGGKGGIVSHFDQFFGEYIAEQEKQKFMSFSHFVEEIELGYAEEFFDLDEEAEYEDWGEEEEEAEVYAVIHEKKGPCWTGYDMVGMKKKGGKSVPNCVPVKEDTKRVDMSGKTCASCGKGKYHEMSVHDDWEGKLTCSNSKCGDRVDRWKKPSVKEEAEKGGRKVTLNKPFLTPGENKKRAVYVKNDKGNVVKVRFGDPNMRIKKSSPAHRKSFRARHGCDVDAGPKWKAKYWSCKAW